MLSIMLGSERQDGVYRNTEIHLLRATYLDLIPISPDGS